MTNKLNEMWAALAAYQPQADAVGHGESWARMCEKKTYDAADAAANAAAYAAVYAAADAAVYAAADAAAAAADAAANAARATANAAAYVAVYAAADAAAYAAADAAYADNWAEKAVDRIKKITTPPAAQRTWVDLTPDDIQNCYGGSVDDFARALLAKSKERNT
jgi:hypothetical protein